MHEPLKNRTYLGKELFLNFLGADFLAPKSGDQREKQPVLGPGCILNTVSYTSIHSFLYIYPIVYNKCTFEKKKFHFFDLTQFLRILGLYKKS